MKVSTPTINLDVRIDAMGSRDGKLHMSGVAGMLPCELSISPSEIRKLLRLAIKPATLRLILSKEK